MENNEKFDSQSSVVDEVVDFRLDSTGSIIFFSKEKILNLWNKSSSKDKFFLAKDNFWTKDFPTTASSLFLRNFSVTDDATAITALKKENYQLLGKSVLDEFACGGTGLFASQGAVYNPLNKEHLVGGSSSGSAAAVAAGIVTFALAHDTGDSVRRPASYCGIFGFKPSYGLVSRYGVIPMAASLDTVGLLSSNLSIIKKTFDVIAFPDDKDLVTISAWKKKTIIASEKLIGIGKSIAILNGIEEHLSSEYSISYLQAIEKFRKLGYKIKSIDFPPQLREHLQITYLIICSSELVSHLNSLQGVTFGSSENFREESVESQRNELIGKWAKERIILGSYFLDNQKIIKRARQMRGLVSEWLNKVFLENRFLIFPGTISSAPRAELFNEDTMLRKTSWVDNLLLLANFSGNPSLNIPLHTEKGMPISLNIDSYWGNDEEILKLAEIFLEISIEK